MSSPTIIGSRKCQWVSSVKPENAPALESLARAMVGYYTNTSSYYEDISFATQNWMDRSELAYQSILEGLEGNRILEIGCGTASVLETKRIAPEYYWGCDFSAQLLESNKKHWPTANFAQLSGDQRLPFADALFDTVFFIFVLEHTIYPHRFLNECMRVLRPGGRLIVLCPDFLGQGRMTSQRAGLSPGTGSEKFRRGAYWDALLTAWDSRVRIPLLCWRLRQHARNSSRFYINLEPVCFTDKFMPDVDAVYLTYEPEIRRYLATRVEFEDLAPELAEYVRRHKLILLLGRRTLAVGRPPLVAP